MRWVEEHTVLIKKYRKDFTEVRDIIDESYVLYAETMGYTYDEVIDQYPKLVILNMLFSKNWFVLEYKYLIIYLMKQDGYTLNVLSRYFSNDVRWIREIIKRGEKEYN